jgi:ParB family transcriptional regulator, chromosome partitioning protein
MARSRQLGVSEHTPNLIEVELERIRPNPNQPRRPGDPGLSDASIRELADNIAQFGLLQPIIVVPSVGEEDTYVLGGGQRRLRAVQLLKWTAIPAITAKTGSAEEIALIENLQRQELNPVDAALAYAALQRQHEWTQEQLADALKVNRVTLTEHLRILDLPEDILEESRQYQVPKTALIALARKDDPAEQRSLWEQMKAGSITVRMARGGGRPRKDASGGDGAGNAVPEELAQVERALAFGKQLLEKMSKVRVRPIAGPEEGTPPEEAERLKDLSEAREKKLEELRDVYREIGKVIRRIEMGETPEKKERKRKAAPPKTKQTRGTRGRPRKHPSPPAPDESDGPPAG